MDIIVRKCCQEDLPAVAGLMQELGETARTMAELSLETIQQMWNLMEASPETYLTLVAEMDQEVVGAATMLFYRSFLHQVGSAQINELVVARGWRGRKIGEKLVDACRHEALNRNMDELEVGTEADNLPALAFYRKAGFNEEYVLFGMELEDEHARR